MRKTIKMNIMEHKKYSVIITQKFLTFTLVHELQ
jgi:hypothetical protein